MAKLNMRCAALLLLAQFTLTLGQTTAPTYAPTPPGHTYDRGTYAPSVTTDAPTFTLSPTVTTGAPTVTTAAPTVTTISPSTTSPSSLAPTSSPSTGAPTESPTVPPTMPWLTDAQAVAAIAASRARVAHRNNAVAPASLDPTADGFGGLLCPPDYHLMGKDDKALDHAGTLYVPRPRVEKIHLYERSSRPNNTHRVTCNTPALETLARSREYKVTNTREIFRIFSSTLRGLSRDDGLVEGAMWHADAWDDANAGRPPPP